MGEKKKKKVDYKSLITGKNDIYKGLKDLVYKDKIYDPELGKRIDNPLPAGTRKAWQDLDGKYEGVLKQIANRLNRLHKWSLELDMNKPTSKPPRGRKVEPLEIKYKKAFDPDNHHKSTDLHEVAYKNLKDQIGVIFSGVNLSTMAMGTAVDPKAIADMMHAKHQHDRSRNEKTTLKSGSEAYREFFKYIEHGYTGNDVNPIINSWRAGAPPPRRPNPPTPPPKPRPPVNKGDDKKKNPVNPPGPPPPTPPVDKDKNPPNPTPPPPVPPVTDPKDVPPDFPFKKPCKEWQIKQIEGMIDKNDPNRTTILFPTGPIAPITCTYKDNQGRELRFLSESEEAACESDPNEITRRNNAPRSSGTGGRGYLTACRYTLKPPPGSGGSADAGSRSSQPPPAAASAPAGSGQPKPPQAAASSPSTSCSPKASFPPFASSKMKNIAALPDGHPLQALACQASERQNELLSRSNTDYKPAPPPQVFIADLPRETRANEKITTLGFGSLRPSIDSNLTGHIIMDRKSAELWEQATEWDRNGRPSNHPAKTLKEFASILEELPHALAHEVAHTRLPKAKGRNLLGSKSTLNETQANSIPYLANQAEFRGLYLKDEDGAGRKYVAKKIVADNLDKMIERQRQLGVPEHSLPLYPFIKYKANGQPKSWKKHDNAIKELIKENGWSMESGNENDDIPALASHVREPFEAATGGLSPITHGPFEIEGDDPEIFIDETPGSPQNNETETYVISNASTQPEFAAAALGERFIELGNFYIDHNGQLLTIEEAVEHGIEAEHADRFELA